MTGTYEGRSGVQARLLVIAAVYILLLVLLLARHFLFVAHSPSSPARSPRRLRPAHGAPSREAAPSTILHISIPPYSRFPRLLQEARRRDPLLSLPHADVFVRIENGTEHVVTLPRGDSNIYRKPRG